MISFLEKRLDLPSDAPRVSSVPVSRESPVEAARLVAPLPGCLTMPKLLLACQRGVSKRED